MIRLRRLTAVALMSGGALAVMRRRHSLSAVAPDLRRPLLWLPLAIGTSLELERGQAVRVMVEERLLESIGLERALEDLPVVRSVARRGPCPCGSAAAMAGHRAIPVTRAAAPVTAKAARSL